MFNSKSIAIAAIAGISLTAFAQKKYEEMDYGPFLTASWDNTKGENTLKGKGCTANKGMAIKLGNNEGAMLWDTDLCRWAGGWTGGYVKYKGVIFDGGHGPNPGPATGATVVFETNPGPTWSTGNFEDPRPLPKGPGAAKVPFGPLPKEQAKHKGVYVSGNDVVVSYTVGTAALLEMPALEKVNDVSVLTRTVNVTGAGPGGTNILWQGNSAITLANDAATIREGDKATVITLVGAPDGVTLDAANAEGDTRGNAAVRAKIRAFAPGQKFKVAYASGPVADEAKLLAAAKGVAKAADLAPLTKGGPRRWTQDVSTPLKAGTPGEHDAYVVDTVTVPFENPYKSWMRIGAFDFMPDGRIAVGTWSGDVWLVTVNKDFTGEAKWQRVATGLFQALGVKVVDGKIYVHGREGLTRLHDLNGDGETDYYENFNNDIQTTPGFHEFAFDLQTDSQGDFYFAKGGPVNPGGGGFQPFSDHAGTILKVSKDGSKLEVFATGVRAPNGISVGPGDVVTTGDNEGSWVPKSYLHIVKPKSFITVASLSHQEPQPTDYGRHVCFMPKDVDNSGGGQAWVTGDNWGLPKGTLLHMSYGTSTLYGVVREEVGGVPQGGVYKFPLKFESGTMRARFSPFDGQLWVSGLKGWQSNAAKDGSLQRVRYTGKPVTFPGGLNVKKNGIEISFLQPLDESATDVGNYSVKQWNYKWSANYGSGEFKLDGKPGTESVEVKFVKVSDDKKRVFLEIENVQPVMQMDIKFNVKAASGAPVPNRIISTINAVP